MVGLYGMWSRSGTLAMISSKVNGPVANGSTR